jgi:hypothetical protein
MILLGFFWYLNLSQPKLNKVTENIKMKLMGQVDDCVRDKVIPLVTKELQKEKSNFGDLYSILI